MSHAEDVLKLRKRILDAVNAGIIDNNLKEFYEATLLQILNESERQRQTCANQAEALRKQAAIADGQAAAYASNANIIFSVINAYIMTQERIIKEEEARAAEKAEKELYAKSLEESIKDEETKIKSKKK
jgi:hypothetical protein